MFGYIAVNKPELKIREFDEYQSFYCGLCCSLKRTSGRISQMTLTYDMTFLALLLTALYEEETELRMERCPIRPWRKVRKSVNPMTDYAACMNVLLACYNLQDDWIDDRSLKSGIEYRLLIRKTGKIAEKYPRQSKAVLDYLQELHRCESERTADLDLAAGLTGRMLGEVFACRDDIWADDLRQMGFFLGKYIYLMDAWEDMEEDRKSGSYNPWLVCREQILAMAPKTQTPEDFFESYILQILTMMMAETTRAFERLPILEHAEILRNILYSGIWSKYESVKKEKAKDLP